MKQPVDLELKEKVMGKENYYYNKGQVFCKTTMQKCPIDDTVTGSSCPYCSNNPNNLFINGSDGITLVTSESNCIIPHVDVAVCPVCGTKLTFYDAEGYCHKCKEPR